jgi:hypothetical protein
MFDKARCNLRMTIVGSGDEHLETEKRRRHSAKSEERGAMNQFGLMKLGHSAPLPSNSRQSPFLIHLHELIGSWTERKDRVRVSV